MTLRERTVRLVESRGFQRTVVGVIVLNAITLGLETYDWTLDAAGEVLHALDRVIIGTFIVELLLRVFAHRGKFFKDPWNLFDVLVVAISVVPASGKLSVLRALRIVRALRLVNAVPGMRRVVSGLLRALPGMASIIVLLGLVLYVGSVLATELYGQTAPESFGHLGTSLFTLFQVMTGEAWPEIAAQVIPTHPTAGIFFVLFILVSTFMVLNLFTAGVVSAMEPEVAATDPALLAEIRALRDEVAALRQDSAPAGPPPAPHQSTPTP